MPQKYEGVCKYLRIWEDGLCNRSCRGEYCGLHKRLIKRHNGVSPPSCTNCNKRGSWSVRGICNKCIKTSYHCKE